MTTTEPFGRMEKGFDLSQAIAEAAERKPGRIERGGYDSECHQRRRDGGGGQFRPVALLDGGVEGVAIDMGDRQPGVGGDDPRRTTARAAARGGAFVGEVGEAVAAEPRRGGGRRTAAQGDDSPAGPESASRARITAAGSIPCAAAKASSSGSSAARWSSSAPTSWTWPAT